MSNKELFNIIKKHWANVEDIMEITNCKRDFAQNLLHEIKEDAVKEGFLVQKKVIPMARVLKKLGISLEKVAKNAELEK